MKRLTRLSIVFMALLGAAGNGNAQEPLTDYPLWLHCRAEGVGAVVGYGDAGPLFDSRHQGVGRARMKLSESTTKGMDSDIRVFESGLIQLDAERLISLLASDSTATHLDAALTIGSETVRLRFSVNDITGKLCMLGQTCNSQWVRNIACSETPASAVRALARKLLDVLRPYLDTTERP